jgi:diguanylate cyclase (GGDEF)-like protein
MQDEAGLVIHASTGRFTGQRKVDNCLDAEKLEQVRAALQQGEIKIADSSTIVPLRLGELTLGVIYLDRPAIHNGDRELLNIFANQAVVAVQNAQLYEMATLDPLTGVYTRRFFDQWLVRALRTAFRSQQMLALIMLDVDDLKRINDAAGHLAGDLALTTVGKGLRESTRSSDMVGRYGGDEFAVILPQARAEGAERVIQRLVGFLRDKPVLGPEGPIALKVSAGLGALEPHSFDAAKIPHPIAATYFEAMARLLIQQADAGLYQAKHTGGNRLCQTAPIAWQANFES